MELSTIIEGVNGTGKSRKAGRRRETPEVLGRETEGYGKWNKPKEIILYYSYLQYAFISVTSQLIIPYAFKKQQFRIVPK